MTDETPHERRARLIGLLRDVEWLETEIENHQIVLVAKRDAIIKLTEEIGREAQHAT